MSYRIIKEQELDRDGNPIGAPEFWIVNGHGKRIGQSFGSFAQALAELEKLEKAEKVELDKSKRPSLGRG